MVSRLLVRALTQTATRNSSRKRSPASRLLQTANAFSPVGAGLPANVRLRQCPLIATVRQQAGSYKDKHSKPLTASERLLCGGWPAGESSPAAVPVDRQDSPAGWLLQGQGEQSVHRQRAFVFVGAGLPANLRLRQCPLIATVRQQAGSYRGKGSKAFTASGRLSLWGLACKRFVQLKQCSLAPKFAGRSAPTQKQHLSRGVNCESKPGECQSATAVTTLQLSVVCHADFVKWFGREHEGQRAHGRRERQQGEAHAVVAGQVGEHARHHGSGDLPHGNDGS